MALSKSTRNPVGLESFPLVLQELKESDNGNYTCVVEALLRNTLQYNVTDYIVIEIQGLYIRVLIACDCFFFFYPCCLFLSCLPEICVIVVLISSVFSLFSFVFFCVGVGVGVVVVAIVVVLDVLAEEGEKED